ncbi:GDF11-like protein [Mya arenaria]|uniref:GDF11-like protein n=1 Tax=Mya arenaria TaxID=6604 RepID=A0ABY7DA21_MYAAR|nr:growth/differentiation factor 8-like [Mya arenaria]WAQ94113.1 GDF11-like protein [Mya arenaria]
MNFISSVVYVCLCATVCSMAKIKSEEKEIQNKERDKSSMNLKRTFENKDDIPKDYLEQLMKRYEISEDPLADRDKRKQEFEEKYGVDYPYDDFNYYYYNYDTDVQAEPDEESDSVIDSNLNDKQPKGNDTSDGDENLTCPTCQLREEARVIRIETIRNTILDKIGFSSSNLPNMTGKVIPNLPSIQRLKDQHMMLADEPASDENTYIPEDELYGQIKRAYTIAQKPPAEFNIHLDGATYFEIPESVTSRRIQDASLWIYIKPTVQKQKKVFEIYLHIVEMKAKPHDILNGPKRYKKTTEEGWVEFKFAHIAHHWIKRPEANRGIIIHVLDSAGNNVAVTPQNEEDKEHFPMLEMSTTEHNDHHHRSKRFINNICSEREKRTTCCRYPLRVDFVQFGWDWVIAPTGYTANYCSGECRHRHLDNDPSAYLIQQATNDSSPCCAAQKWYPLAMLYFDHKHTVLYTYMQKMIVDRCACS